MTGLIILAVVGLAFWAWTRYSASCAESARERSIERCFAEDSVTWCEMCHDNDCGHRS
jgi:cytochrome c553